MKQAKRLPLEIMKKLSYFGKAFFIIATANIALAISLKCGIIEKLFEMSYEKFVILLKTVFMLEVFGLVAISLILLQRVVSVMGKFFEIKLTYRIIMGFALGIILGIMMRNFPDYFGMLGLKAVKFKILGMIFLDLIKMSIGPLIFASIACSILGDDKNAKVGKMAFKSIITFIVMTVISVVIGMSVTNYIKPGSKINIKVEDFISGNESANGVIAKASSGGSKTSTGLDMLLDIIPSNIFKSFYEANFLQIIFFAAIFGIAIKVSRGVDSSIGVAIKGLNDVMFKISDIVMHVAPFGVFGFTVWIVGSQDMSLIKSLLAVIGIVYGSILFMVYVLYSLFMMFALRLNPLQFIKKMFDAQFTGFLLASSSAVLSTSLNIAQKKLGVSKEKAMFIIPFGATINTNGSALNLGVSVIFISQVFGMTFDMSQYCYILGLCTLGAIGTAPIPGASIFILSGILSSVGLPIEGIALILAIDRLLDMMRTFGNISGDVLSSVIIDRFENTLNEKIWNSK
jgi:Na+/H+-dicarboxylate symporter